VSLENELIYSKLETRRHAEPGEVASLARKFLEEGL
jgi:hypothetical protein